MFMQTYTGKKFHPLDPKYEDIDIKDVAHSLSLQCRFAGHCKQFYSVAEHCFLVSRILLEGTGDAEIALCGLLHDATEAYLVDLPRPVKKGLPEYRALEDKMMIAVRKKFDLPEFKNIVWVVDDIALATEAKVLMPDTTDWETVAKVSNIPLLLLDPRAAEELYLNQFNTLRKLVNDQKIKVA